MVSTTEPQFKRRKPSTPTDAQFGRLVLATQGRALQLGSRLNRGVLDTEEYIQALFDLLEEAHTDAVVLGRQLAGDLTEPELDDLLFAQDLMNREAVYLTGFQNDLLTGRYTDDSGLLKLAQVNARAKLYAGKLRATANETFVLASDVTDTFAWHLLAAESCDDCPRIAAGGPYTADQLKIIGYPSSGRHQCRTNCGCVLVRQRDKVFGFSRSYQ